MAPPNDNSPEDPAALYTAGPAPEKLLRDLQQQLGRLFAAKPAEKFPLMMGTCVIYSVFECFFIMPFSFHR